VESSGIWSQYKSQAEQFICNCLQKGNSNVNKSDVGLLWFLSYYLQYTTAATFIATAYSKYLTAKKASIQCPSGIVQPNELLLLAKSQVYYSILIFETESIVSHFHTCYLMFIISCAITTFFWKFIK